MSRMTESRGLSEVGMKLSVDIWGIVGEWALRGAAHGR